MGGDKIDKNTFYAELCRDLDALIGDERDWVANLANARPF